MDLTHWDWIVLAITLFGIALAYAFYKNTYFQRADIKCMDNKLPFFGHMLRIVLGTEHFVEAVYNVYNRYKDERYVGFLTFSDPIVIIKDLDIIRQIGIKDFDQFVDHRIFMDEESDPLFGRNLFFLRGQRWKEMRVSMSPAYTSSKLKNMFSMFVGCAEQNVAYFQKRLSEMGENDHFEIEMKDISTRYTSDVIASTAFGLKMNSLEDKTNEFYVMGKRATNFSGIQFLKFIGYGACPKLMKLFKIPLFEKPVARFFSNLVHNTMSLREKENIYRPDMIHLLMQAKKGSLKNDEDMTPKENTTGFATIQESALKQSEGKTDWTDDDLTAQAMAFLLAGFDTSSSLICFVAYELCLNPHIQSRLQEEIDEIMIKCDGDFTYTDLLNMKYLDMVVSEALRKWPPDSHLDRLCTAKSYTLPPPNANSNKKYVLKKGDNIFIPTYSIHHDAKYHPDPEKFDPERFSDENKSKLVPNTFIPFGIGPRFCIGARFAVLEAKVIIFYLLTKFDFVKTEKTAVPFKLARDTFIMHCDGGFWMGLRLRKNV